MTMKGRTSPTARRTFHWPEGFNPSQADLFSHNALH